MDFIYEVRDTTSDENYYPLGLFLTLNEAKKIIAEHEALGEAITEYGSDYGNSEHETITIVERKMGWSSDNCKTVIELDRVSYYSDEKDAYLWRSVDA